jgi:hypothetical protein
VENLVAIDGCITTILSLITKKKIKIKNVMIWNWTKNLNTTLVYNLPLHHYNVCVS